MFSLSLYLSFSLGGLFPSARLPYTLLLQRLGRSRLVLGIIMLYRICFALASFLSTSSCIPLLMLHPKSLTVPSKTLESMKLTYERGYLLRNLTSNHPPSHNTLPPLLFLPFYRPRTQARASSIILSRYYDRTPCHEKVVRCYIVSMSEGRNWDAVSKTEGR